MLYFAALLLIVASFIWPKNKAITALWLAFYWILFSFNTANSDYAAYSSIYEYIRVGQESITSVSEEGYIWLARVSSVVFNLSYQQFLVVVSTIATCLVGVIVNKYASATDIVLSLFLMYPYWIMICQYRSYMAVLLVLLGLYYLFERTGKDAYLLYFGLVFLGGLFQHSAWVFAIFFIVKRYDLKRVIVAALLMAVVLRALMSNNTLATLVGGIVTERKANQWLSGDSDRSTLGIALLFLFRAVLLYMEYWLLRQLRDTGHRDERRVELFDYMLRASVLCTAFLVFEMNDRNYERLFRVELFMFYVFIADYIEVYYSKENISLGDMPVRFVCAILFLMLYVVYFAPTLSGWIEHNFYPVFENNLILGSFLS